MNKIDLEKEEPASLFPMLKARVMNIDKIMSIITEDLKASKISNEEHFHIRFEENRNKKWEALRANYAEEPYFVKKALEKMREVGKPDEYLKIMEAVIEGNFDKFEHFYKKVYQEVYKKMYPNREAIDKELNEDIAKGTEKILERFGKIAGKIFPVISLEDQKQKGDGKIVNLFCPLLTPEDHDQDYILDLYTGPVERIPEDLRVGVSLDVIEEIGLEV
jgi:hypothetical protein